MVLRKEIVVIGLSMEDFKNNNVLDRSEVRCPIAAASTVLTDQWSVIVIRDIAFFGFRTFREIISNNNEKIQSSTLAKRLKRLVDIGLLKETGWSAHVDLADGLASTYKSFLETIEG